MRQIANPLNSWKHYTAVEIVHTRRAMRYCQADFEQDWKLAVALAALLALENREFLEPMLDRVFINILAYISNNPDARPFPEE
jgi:hypothetical protein